VGFTGQSAPPDLLTRAAHESFLAETLRRRRGDVDVETAVAAAKLNDAQTLEDACAWPNAR
jgi:membrane glycosyltransferase